ncbi:MAG TPA: S24 family peptidase [Jatrophihabitans sp.]|nr:S24 family peptidase [Jatrophihabitans sp.]
MAVLRNWGWVRVSGVSMTPTLHDGDRVLVHYDRRISAGAVVLGRFPGRVESLVVKRAVRPVGQLWELASDNPRAGSDSRNHGPGEALALAVRLWPQAPSRGRIGWWRRLAGQAIPPAPPPGL